MTLITTCRKNMQIDFINNINLCNVSYKCTCRYCLCQSFNPVSLAYKFSTLSVNLKGLLSKHIKYDIQYIRISLATHLTLPCCSSPQKETYMYVVNSSGVSSSVRRSSTDDLFHPPESTQVPSWAPNITDTAQLYHSLLDLKPLADKPNTLHRSSKRYHTNMYMYLTLFF